MHHASLRTVQLAPAVTHHCRVRRRRTRCLEYEAMHDDLQSEPVILSAIALDPKRVRVCIASHPLPAVFVTQRNPHVAYSAMRGRWLYGECTQNDNPAEMAGFHATCGIFNRAGQMTMQGLHREDLGQGR